MRRAHVSARDRENDRGGRGHAHDCARDFGHEPWPESVAAPSDKRRGHE
jgi:hypothetical protein